MGVFKTTTVSVAYTLTTHHVPTPCGQPYSSPEKSYAYDSLSGDELQARIQKIRLAVRVRAMVKTIYLVGENISSICPLRIPRPVDKITMALYGKTTYYSLRKP